MPFASLVIRAGCHGCGSTYDFPTGEPVACPTCGSTKRDLL